MLTVVGCGDRSTLAVVRGDDAGEGGSTLPPGCGDGICTATETCASCEQDCGPCAVCGNGVCQMPYETCVNCPQDCGQCTTVSCLEILTCSFECVDLSVSPPLFSLTCAGDCVARGCPSAGYFADQAVMCFEDNLDKCQPLSLSCLESQCQGAVTACLGSTCGM